ncbi:MAG: hypothetical protein Q7S60_02475 [bacterium]|nr:hypothetical protein [bacterium]
MGKTKLTIVDQAAPQEKESSKGRSASGRKKPEKKKVHIAGLKGGQRVVAIEAGLPTTASASTGPAALSTKEKTTKRVSEKHRGKKYLAAKMKVEPGKAYTPIDAVKLAKETSISKFDGSIELHLVLNKSSVSTRAELPHGTGKKKKVEIANEGTIEKLKTGKVDFDVLLATADFMPKLVPFAKILGPRGLMPNPKAGTIIQDPKDAEKFSGNTVAIKSEKQAPLVHLVIGKVSQSEKEVSENLEAVISAVGSKDIEKAVIKASMGPAIRVAVV